MSDRVYVGNGKAMETKYGQILNMIMSEEDVKRIQDSLKNGWVDVEVKKRKEPSKTGFTHYMEVNTFEPQTK